jgi:hypothetical protein
MCTKVVGRHLSNNTYYNLALCHLTYGCAILEVLATEGKTLFHSRPICWLMWMQEGLSRKSRQNITICCCTSCRPAFTFLSAHEVTVLKSHWRTAVGFVEWNSSTLNVFSKCVAIFWQANICAASGRIWNYFTWFDVLLATARLLCLCAS